MKVAVIGAGFTGLAAAYRLTKLGHSVTVFEKDHSPGGLAVGYKEKKWDWTMEQHYHHWFTNDKNAISLAGEVGQNVIVKRPKTSIFLDGKLYQLDSLTALLRFSKLSLFERVRMAAVLGFLKLNPFWKPLEKINATSFLPKVMGQKGYALIWEPQLRNKMGKFADQVSLVWFWARIYKRTPSLAYPEGGFLHFANKLVESIESSGGKIFFEHETITIDQKGRNITVTTKNKKRKEKKELFDKVIVTLPSFLFLKITPGLPASYKNKLIRLEGIGATNIVLRLKKQFLQDGTYWLSICEKDSPVMVVVEHTNFMDKKHFDNEHIVYIGNYPSPDSEKFLASKEKLLEMYDPILRKINPDYRKGIIDYRVFKAPFAQPIVPQNYSKLIPPFTTPFPGVFLANIEQVYPWDRATNYAIEKGQQIAKIVFSEK